MLISIIIATYNAAKTIKKCLDSIAAQNTSEVEVILVDGNSEDETVNIASSYSNIVTKLISENDRGIYDAWNKGVKLAEGDWIMFLGADDYLVQGALKKYVEFVNKNDVTAIDIICAKCSYLDYKGKPVRVIGEPYDYDRFRKYMNISHGSSLHNRRLFEELGDFSLDYKICSDYDFLIRRRLNSLFFDEIILCMKTGGMSFTYKALIETYNIRKHHKSIPSLLNVLYLIKSVVGFFIKKRTYIQMI